MASQTPFPFLPPKSTELRLQHFDEHAYKTDSSTVLYNFIDAMCGDGGVGNLKKEIFLQRLSGALDGIYGNALDYIFGGVKLLSRTSSESYSFNTDTAMLTSKQWDEVVVKDAAYRDRIREFFIAAGKGGTVEGIRQAVHAATSADCQVIESWRYIDNVGTTQELGRALVIAYAAVRLRDGHRVYFTDDDPAIAVGNAEQFISEQDVPEDWVVEQVRPRNEVTIVPHKKNYSGREARVLWGMLDRITPQDTVITINPEGLAVNSPVSIRAAASDSTYFQVEKTVTATPELDNLPAPETLAIDLDPTEKWLFSKSPELAPYARFNITQEYGYYYLVSGGNRSPIDTVSYGTLQADGTVKAEPDFEWYEQTEEYGPWTAYPVTTDPGYASQADYVAAKKAEVLAQGGEADDYAYRLPVQKATTYKRTYTADLAIATTAPTRDSTITSSWTSRRTRTSSRNELRNPALFVR